jgi:hypothetical protein
MNKEILYEILNSKSETLSSTEIENIMNEELDKSPQDMDTDLIDLCLEALNTVDKKKINKRKLKYRFGRTFIAAVIFVLIIVITIPACAKYFSVNVPDGIITLYRECFHLDISPDVYINDIIKQFEQDGIDNIVLPEIVFDKDTVISNYSCVVDSNVSTSNFDFKNEDIIGRITIEKYNNFDFFSGKGEISTDFENIEYIDRNGIEVLVFSKDNLSYINYSSDKVDYNIVLHSDFDTAYKIAESI